MDPLFAHRPLSTDGLNKVNEVRRLFDEHLKNLQPLIAGSGRYEAILRTKLEEACYAAVKGVATQPGNQDK